MAENYWKQVKTTEKKAIFERCKELYRSIYPGEAFVVSFWLPKYIDNLGSKDLSTFKVRIERYINI